ncbi:hypothetical protein FPQ18DRAFT_262381 [Pyronema domesticum]|nr:hypothetical protein FPQ18DRAFT_262381 [Pyronema domesticum]
MGPASYARRHSTFDPRPVPYTTSRPRRPSTPGLESGRRELLPPIQSYPLSESDPDEPISPGTVQPAVASADEQIAEESLNAPANGFSGRRHRLSIMSASEHASTLIGCESEHDFGSDTLFDSLRTRTSENAPVRADHIFDYEPRGPLDTRPMTSIEANGIPIATSSTPAQTECVDSGDSSLSSSRTAQPHQHQRQASVNLEDDEDGWSGSDWDAPSKSADEDDRLQGLPHRPYSGIFTTDSRVLLGLQQNNTTRDSFSTVREGMSIDESSSILDWNDGVSMHTQNSQSRDYRPKTTHAKESTGTRIGRRAPTYHTRSQSVPVNVKAIPLSDRPIVPSENWDDDFFGDDGDEDCDRNIVVPRAIEESQQSIIGHLGIVREFALLVEELKRLRSIAISKGVRYKVDCELWDEADAIIALATQDEDEDKSSPLKKEGLRRNTTWSPAQQRRRGRNQQILDDNNSAYTTVSSRHTVLAPDDDIFGGGENTATPRQSRRISPTPSSISRKVIDLNDPVQCSRGLMEKMILRQSQESLRPHCGADGKLCFDTGMLENLVDQTKSIRDRCRISAEGYSQSAPNPTIDRGDKGDRSAPLKLKIRPEHQQQDEKFDFDLSPIKSSIADEDLRLDRVDSRALEFTPVIGVA